MRRSKLEVATVVVLATLLIAGAACLLAMPQREVVVARFATSLRGRSSAQIHNARLATEAIDGTVVRPGRVFSFNKTVGLWQAETGYRRAPVSYDGELVLAWGGGVCQVSTALYNAALLAGTEILERSRHSWAPSYVAPGRDAAVASGGIDLRFRNTLPWPIRIRGKVAGESLMFEMLAREPLPWRVQVTANVDAVRAPCEVLQLDPALAPGRRRVVTEGQPGFRACVYRTFLPPGGAPRRQLVSADSYPPLNRVVHVGPERPG